MSRVLHGRRVQGIEAMVQLTGPPCDDASLWTDGTAQTLGNMSGRPAVLWGALQRQKETSWPRPVAAEAATG